MTDQSVPTEYLAWLQSIWPRQDIRTNEAWNAGVAYERARSQVAIDALKAELAEVRKNALEADATTDYQCRKCLHSYIVRPGASEDCPKCGFDGKESP